MGLEAEWALWGEGEVFPSRFSSFPKTTSACLQHSQCLVDERFASVCPLDNIDKIQTKLMRTGLFCFDEEKDCSSVRFHSGCQKK